MAFVRFGSRFENFARASYSILAVVPLTLFFSSLALIAGIFELPFYRKFQSEGRWGPATTFIKYIWAKWILGTHGIRILTEGPGAKNVMNRRGVIFVSNHQSALDIPVIVAALSSSASFVAKHELKKIPFFGWAAPLAGVLFIDRAKGSKNESLKLVSERLRSGLSIIIFPEGTRSMDGGLLPFKKGAFVIAIEAGAKIVPVAIMGSRSRLKKGSLGIRPGDIHLWVGDAVDASQYKIEDRQTLADEMHAIVRKQLDNFSENRKNS